MRLAQLKPRVAAAAALILATAGVAVQGRQQPASEGARQEAKTAPPPAAGVGAAGSGLAARRALARVRLTLVDEVQAMLHGLARNGRVDFASPSFSIWEAASWRRFASREPGRPRSLRRR